MNEMKLKMNDEGGTLKGLLKKVRCDSNWNGLTTGQCETMEQWLFEDNLGYAETAERVQREFGVALSQWSVGRFYRQRARVRQSLEVLEAQVTADQLGAMPADTGAMRAAAMKLVAKSAVRLATEKPEAPEQMLPLARVLLESEQNEIRLRRVKLEERYYDFEANASCAKDLKKVRSYLLAVGDNENLSAAEKQQRVVELLFGREQVSVSEAEEAESAEEALEEAEDWGKGAESDQKEPEK